MGRAPALLIALVALAVYYGAAPSLPDASTWLEVAVLAVVVFPLMFSLPGLGLPLATAPWLPVAVVGLGVATAALSVAGFELAANFTKFAAVVGLGWVITRVFESANWVALVALIIVPVDIYSVARGPTKTILEDQPGVFDKLSIFFPPPGSESFAQLGLPDVLFFAIFVATAARFGLRTLLTWILCTASFGGSMALALLIDENGVPALPLLSAGFLLANADLLLKAAVARGPNGAPAG